VGAGLICTAFALVTNAQVQTQTEVETGPATREITVRSGEVVYVSGNDVVIRGDDGLYRDFPNVPDSQRVTVDGKELSVHDLRPGMVIARITITTTRPRLITTIKTVSGTVWSVTPPTSVILTLEDGTNQQFNIPAGTKFMVNGESTDAFALRKGMKISATAVTEKPETVVRKRVRTIGEMPPAPPKTIDPDAALIIEVPIVPETADTAPAQTAPAEAGAETAAEPAPARLPRTGSSLPLVGLLGGLFCSLALGLKTRRTLCSCPVVTRNRPR
jgi:hypothetical protein